MPNGSANVIGCGQEEDPRNPTYSSDRSINYICILYKASGASSASGAGENIDLVNISTFMNS
jgi:hypothetical protein